MATKPTRKTGAQKKGRRGNITAEAREKGAISKSQRGIFNKYMKALQGRSIDKNRQKIAEIEEMLARGTRFKKAPIFKKGRGSSGRGKGAVLRAQGELRRARVCRVGCIAALLTRPRPCAAERGQRERERTDRGRGGRF